MTVKSTVIQAAANTGGTVQDIVEAGFGTPSSAVVVVVGDDVLNLTEEVTCNFCIGARDGTDQGCAATQAVNANGTRSRRSQTNTRIIQVHNHNSGTDNLFLRTATAVLIADGIRITWSAAPPQAYIMTVLLFGDTTDVSSNLVQFTFPLGGTAGQTINVGFLPDLLIFFSARTGSFGATVAVANAGMSLGVCARVGLTQASKNWYRQDLSAGTVAAALVQGEIYRSISNTAFLEGASVTNISGTSVTLTGTAATSPFIHCLALRFNNRQTWVEIANTNQTVFTSPGFRPQLVGNISSFLEAITPTTGAPILTSLAGAFSAGFADQQFASTGRRAMGGRCQDAANGAGSIGIDSAYECQDHTGAVGYRGEIASLDPTGFTLNRVVTPAVPKFGIWWAVQEEAGATTVPMPFAQGRIFAAAPIKQFTAPFARGRIFDPLANTLVALELLRGRIYDLEFDQLEFVRGRIFQPQIIKAVSLALARGRIFDATGTYQVLLGLARGRVFAPALDKRTQIDFAQGRIYEPFTGEVIEPEGIDTMAIEVSTLHVWNMAATMLNTNLVNATGEDSPSANTFRKVWDVERTDFLMNYRGVGAVKHATLVQLSSIDPPRDWQYAYRLPYNFLALITINPDRNNSTPEIEYRLEPNALMSEPMLLTQESAAEILYVANVENLNLLPRTAVKALAMQLAISTAPVFSKSQAEIDRMELRFEKQMQRARTRSSQSQSPKRWADFDLVASRFRRTR